MPLCTPCYPSQTVLWCVMGICYLWRWRRGHTQRHFKSFGLFFPARIWCIPPNRTLGASAFYLIMSLWSWNQHPRQINSSSALRFTMCNRAIVLPRSCGTSMFCLSYTFQSHREPHRQTHQQAKPHDHLLYWSIIRVCWWGRSRRLPSNKTKAYQG